MRSESGRRSTRKYKICSRLSCKNVELFIDTKAYKIRMTMKSIMIAAYSLNSSDTLIRLEHLMCKLT